MTELKVLQAVRLKGRVTADDVAATVDGSPEAVWDELRVAADSGLVIEGKTIRLSDTGRVRLAELLAAERNAADSAVVTGAYAEFRHVNADFKALIADWQIRSGEPNPHDDEQYDSAVLVRLDAVHATVTPIIATLTEELPRLDHYSTKLQSALEKVHAGETSWLTRPIVDSYHTVWFELHEEFIIAAGLTREDEAKAGHAH